MKTVAIVQARMGSTRLPNKVMKPICGIPMIELLMERLSKAKELDQIIVATSVDECNISLVQHVHKLGFICQQGSENDVLDRYINAAKTNNADIVVRITGDCPLVDPALVDEAVRRFKSMDIDYLSNINPPTFPDGLDIEVFTLSALEIAERESDTTFDREHVTPYLKNNKKFSKGVINHSEDLSHLRWTVDEPEDLQVITRIFEFFSPNILFSWKEVLELQQTQPMLFSSNLKLQRNEGAIMGKGQKLYKRAKKIIPGGTMLLSKRPEMFLPDQWPAYFSKSKGCRVWDLEDREYIDMSIMGIGTNILGYGDPEVDNAVIETVNKGNMSTFSCPEEVSLIEKLLEMHPWADMGRLARAGGEINSIAIRIARASNGRDKVAICGYHGWHDWYLSTNLNNDKDLDGHLIPGLQPRGVPRGLTGTTLPFEYNNIEQLEKLINDNPDQISAIKMEVSRNEGPKDNFLHKVRKLATDNNIVLIFDECTSGFRESFGGLHKKYGVNPDLAIFAKALGNGYAISACIGRKDIMTSAEETFISSTFWTERVGPTAALKTLEVMERKKSWEVITTTGLNIRENWEKLAKKYDLDITTWGLPALSGFSFNYANNLAYKTLITQEMLKMGYLAGNNVYVCTQHTPKIVADFFEVLDPIFALVQECEDGRDVISLLNGPVCHSGFKRLN
ncbi:aminotransferase class III-fold pyridoxal phosphate-dependent enzyme [Gammaproteobacteria bacterium]|nr:aminotransferase class III-fold pyridoxal phosphate-dependent enzyme [Gammaproteobacteria bacterium]MDC3306814.1 aminotransferase class III-fold pyridoxal phosphate-dependent enzyme [Gammaproteobacteria bacterium]